MTDLVNSAICELQAQGYSGDIEIYRSVEARYFGQNHELELSFPANEFNRDSISDLWRRFHQEHQSRFGFCIPGETIETVHLKVVGICLLKKPQVKTLREQSGLPESKEKRQVRFEAGWQEVPVYARDSLGQGCHITGPAIIEETSSATVLCADQNLVIDAYGNLLISA